MIVPPAWLTTTSCICSPGIMHPHISEGLYRPVKRDYSNPENFLIKEIGLKLPYNGNPLAVTVDHNGNILVSYTIGGSGAHGEGSRSHVLFLDDNFDIMPVQTVTIPGTVYSLAIAHNGDLVARTVGRIYVLESNNMIRRIKTDFPVPYGFNIAINSRDEIMVTGDQGLSLYKLTGEPLGVNIINWENEPPSGIAFNSQGDIFVGYLIDGRIRVYNSTYEYLYETNTDPASLPPIRLVVDDFDRLIVWGFWVEQLLGFFNPDGRNISKLNLSRQVEQGVFITSIGIDKVGRIICVDNNHGRLLVVIPPVYPGN